MDKGLRTAFVEELAERQAWVWKTPDSERANGAYNAIIDFADRCGFLGQEIQDMKRDATRTAMARMEGRVHRGEEPDYKPRRFTQ
jgi:hypothetical protein